MRVVWLITLVLAQWPFAARAHDAKRFALNWVRESGAESCISSHRLAQLLQQALGPVLVTADEAELAIEGHVRVETSDGATSWHARIAVSDRQGRLLGVRELGVRDAPCSALDPQVLLVIAMAIDPEVALDGLPEELLAQLGAPDDAAAALLAELRAEQAARQPPPETEVDPSAVASEPEPSERPRSVAERAPPAPVFGAFAYAAFAAGLLPEARPGLALGLELHLPPRWALRAVGLVSAPSTRVIESPFLRSASVRFDAALVALSACGSPLRTHALRASACLGMALLLRGSEARGLERAPDASTQTLAPQLEAVLAYTALAPLALSLSAGLYVPLQATRFAYGVAGAPVPRTLYEASPIAFSALLGAEIEL